jgi:hypothetical protein
LLNAKKEAQIGTAKGHSSHHHWSIKGGKLKIVKQYSGCIITKGRENTSQIQSKHSIRRKHSIKGKEIIKRGE